MPNSNFAAIDIIVFADGRALGAGAWTSAYITYWDRVTHLCGSKITIIGSDNGLSPGRRQAIILTNAGVLLIGPVGTKFSEILIEILTVPFKKMRLKWSSAKWRPFCLGLNVLITISFGFFTPVLKITVVDTIRPSKQVMTLTCCHWWHRKLSYLCFFHWC